MPIELNIAIWIILYMLCAISILFTYHVFQRHKQIKKELDEREENLKEYIEKIKQWSENPGIYTEEDFRISIISRDDMLIKNGLHKENKNNRPITKDDTVEPACKVNTCGLQQNKKKE